MLERAGLLPPSCSWGKGREWLRGISPDSDTVLLSPEPDTLSKPFLQDVSTRAQYSSVYKPICIDKCICHELALHSQDASQDIHAQGHIARSMLQQK